MKYFVGKIFVVILLIAFQTRVMGMKTKITKNKEQKKRENEKYKKGKTSGIRRPSYGFFVACAVAARS